MRLCGCASLSESSLFRYHAWVNVQIFQNPELQKLKSYNLQKGYKILLTISSLNLVGWLVGFVALRPKSTAMVIAGRSVHLTTLFPGQA